MSLSSRFSFGSSLPVRSLLGAAVLLFAGALVLPGQTTNLALGKPATQSSTYAPEYGPQACVDGNRTSGFCHTNREANPWWQVDLGAQYQLSQIVVYNRDDQWGIRERTLQALLSTDGQSWTRIYSHNGANTPVIRISAGNRTARYVRMQLNETEYMNITEVEVYGAGGAPEPPTIGSGSVAGEWESGATWGHMSLQQSGSTVSGTFSNSNGHVQGTVQGSQLTGIWTQDSSGRACSQAASNGSRYWGQLQMSVQGDSFTGLWGYCDDAPSVTFEGTRAKPTGGIVPPPTTTPLAVTLRSDQETVIIGSAVTTMASAAGGQAPYRYQWFDNSSSSPESSATARWMPSPSGAHTFRVIVTDRAGTTAQAAHTVTVESATPPAGNLNGTVTSGNPPAGLLGARVLIGRLSLQSGAIWDTVTCQPLAGDTYTNAQGNYSANVPPGTYDMVFWKQGYVPQTLNNVSVPGRQNASLNVNSPFSSTTHQQLQLTSTTGGGAGGASSNNSGSVFYSESDNYTLRIASSGTGYIIEAWCGHTPDPTPGQCYNKGLGTLMPDRKTIHYVGADVAGYCCGNNVEWFGDFADSQTFVQFNGGRAWPMNGSTPAPVTPNPSSGLRYRLVR